MKIFHICSYYSSSAIYKKLFSEMSKHPVKQYIFFPTHKKRSCNDFDMLNNCKIICHKSYRYFDRFFYVTKINKIYKGFLQELGTKLNGKCLFHAHSLFINGAVAFKLKKKTNINYVVAVRSTDVKVFFKYLFFLRSFGINILMDASKIIFISHVYRDLVLKNYVSDKDRKIILDKCVVIPNGIDGFWHENSLDIKEYSMKSPIKVLYVGQFIKRKNSLKLIKSITALKDDGIDEAERHLQMKKTNPKYVFRNYLAQLAIDALESGDDSILHSLHDVLRTPFDEHSDQEDWAGRMPEWARDRAGCSALSCSS